MKKKIILIAAAFAITSLFITIPDKGIYGSSRTALTESAKIDRPEEKETVTTEPLTQHMNRTRPAKTAYSVPDPVKESENKIMSDISKIWDFKNGQLRPGCDTSRFDKITAEINSLPDSSKHKKAFLTTIQTAKNTVSEQNRYRTAAAAVSRVWNMKDGGIPKNLTETQVNAAQNAVNLLSDRDPQKKELQKMVNASRDALRNRLTAKAEADRKKREAAARKAAEEAKARIRKEAAQKAAALRALEPKASLTPAPDVQYEYNHSCPAAKAAYNRLISLLNSGAHGEQTLCKVSPAEVETECIHAIELIDNDLIQLVSVDVNDGYYGDGTIVIDVDSIRSKKAQNDALAADLHNLGRSAVTPGMTEREAVKAINDWICAHYTYNDTGNNSHTAAYALNTGNAVCQAYATTFAEMARGAGLKAECVYGIANGGGHEWNRVMINGTWCYIDVCWNDCTQSYHYGPTVRLWSDHTEKFPY